MKKIFCILILAIINNTIAQKNINNTHLQYHTEKTEIGSGGDPEFDPEPEPGPTSSEVGFINGDLSVSLSGSSNYTIPIDVPPGINGVVPQISLNYNNQSTNGLAGICWNLSGLSSITRISSSKHHDNTINPVNFGSLDRFALDGKRLILKSGTYGVPGSTYETEIFSNLRISFLQGPENYFKVEHPDGSVAYYGNSNNSNSGLSYAITSWENPQKLKIIYDYSKTNNYIYIKTIKYGSRDLDLPINEIIFSYTNRRFIERVYTAGILTINNKLLTKITINGNGSGYKSYSLNHDNNPTSYERLLSITETSGNGLKNLPQTSFYYENTVDDIEKHPVLTTISGNFDGGTFPDTSTLYGLDARYLNINGDFNGDGNLDIIRYQKEGARNFLSKYILNQGINFQTNDTSYSSSYFVTERFEDIFPMRFLEGSSPSGFKLSQKDAWCITSVDPITKATNFNVYTSTDNTSDPANLEYSRQYTFPKACMYNLSVLGNAYSTVNKNYLKGDFNGDGLTDLIAIETGASNLDMEDCGSGEIDTFIPGKAYFINLDKRLENNNFVNFAGSIQLERRWDIFTSSRSDQDINYRLYKNIFANDVNGDGKTDIVHFRSIASTANDYNLAIDVYSLNDSNTLTLTSSTTFIVDHHHEKYSGDFNGDGKTDFIVGIDDGSYIYTSTGNSFIRTSSNITVGNVLTILDYDNDGKSDIIKSTRTPEKDLAIDFYKNTNGSFSGTAYNKRVLLEKNFVDQSEYNMYYQFQICSFTSSDNNRRNELSFIGNGSKILRLNFKKNHKKERLLKVIAKGNGTSESISYNKLIDGNGVYTKSWQTENYPNYDLGSFGDIYVVSEVSKSGYNIMKKQYYKYYGFTGNFSGLGSFGFKSILNTNWFNDPSLIISNITKFDSGKRGVPIESFSVEGLASPSLILSSSDTFIKRNLITYNLIDTSSTNPLIFKLQKTFTQDINGLEGISKESIIEYNNNNNPLIITTINKNGTLTEKISIDSFSYNSPTGSLYLIDIPISKNNTTTIYPSNESTSSEEIYTYDNNLLKEIKKKGHQTVIITEENDYDIYGNIIKKTLSAPNLSSRISNFEYDNLTHRFLTKTIDIQGQETAYTYNLNNGLLLTETLPSNPSFPLKNTYYYDEFGKITKQTNYLGKSFNYSYSISLGGILKTVSGDDGSGNSLLTDSFGRDIKRGEKNIDGTWSYVDISYDINDKITSQSQPYSNSPSVWNEVKYDIYGRPIESVSLKSSSSQGRVVTYTYDDLITKEDDGIKSKQFTKNSIGNITSLTEEPGGTINYEYFADGNLKSTNYNGSETVIQQDGWGRKKQLQDPSAGTRKYDYNHFGELIKEEIVGVGVIEYDLDDFGLINIKYIKDNTGNIKSKSKYNYNPQKKLNDIRFDNYEVGTVNFYNYLYDDYRRLIFKDELNPLSYFKQKTEYDDFGRPSREFYHSKNIANNKISEKWIRNSYKNGNKWQIIDDATNKVLYQTNTVNSLGQILTAGYGNGISITNSYNSLGFPTKIKHDFDFLNIMTLNTTFNATTSNLTSRTNSIFGTWNETPLTYDNADRLTSYRDITGIQTQSYNDNGTILSNNIGTYAYTISNKPYQVSTVSPIVPSAVLTYYSTRQQDVTYNIFKSPTTITEQNSEQIDFEYNAFQGRSTMYYGNLNSDKTLRPYRKFYSSDGTMEIKFKTTSPNFTEFTTYVGGDAYTAPIILRGDGASEQYYYLHRDYQGTIVGISDEYAELVEKRLFDVWGQLIKYSNSSGLTTIPTTTSSLFLDRGYTGHEHLLGVGLINMNGRIYDPKLHRFLQPDNNIQDPFNTQNFNRYAYVMNNPTKYTDPSGEFWDWALGFIFSTYVHGGQATGDPNPLNWNASSWANAALGGTSAIASYFATSHANDYIESQNNYTQSANYHDSTSNEVNIFDISDFFSQINDNFHEGLNDRIDHTYNFFSNQITNSIYWANTVVDFGSDFANGRSIFNASPEYKKEIFDQVTGMSINEWAYVTGYSAPDFALGYVAPVAVEASIARIGSIGRISIIENGLGNSLRRGIANSFELHPRITNPYFSSSGNATRGFGYNQFDVGHRASSFLREEIIMNGKFGIKNYRTIYFNYSNGTQNFSIGANPWTRTIYHEGPGIFN